MEILADGLKQTAALRFTRGAASVKDVGRGGDTWVRPSWGVIIPG